METRNWSKELRLGNYIMDSPVNGDEPLKVEAIYSNLVIHEETHIYNDEIRPIPLTEEWLLKFRFEKKEVTMLGTTYVGFLRFSFHLDIKFIENSFFYHWMGGNTDVKYVHQLQNLYHSLCGEELEINLTQE